MATTPLTGATIGRRDLSVELHRVPTSGPIHLIVDSTGL